MSSSAYPGRPLQFHWPSAPTSQCDGIDSCDHRPRPGRALSGIPASPPRTAAPAAPTPSMSIDLTAETNPSAKPAKLQAKRKAKSLQKVEVPASGPGTYQAADKSVRPTTAAGSLIRYDVRVEKGLSIDPDKAAILIQGILDDKRSWRSTGHWRFELTPVGGPATLHAYIVTP